MTGENGSQRGLSRREMLMRGGSVVAPAGIAPPLATAAQNPSSSPASGKTPNILFIMGDDVGIWNISAYHRGMMGGSTPNIDRIAKEGLLFVDHYGTGVMHREARSLHPRAISRSLGAKHGRASRRGGGHLDQRSDDRQSAQAARLRDRTIWQEPPRRSRRPFADQSRLRRIFRHSLSPQRW